MAPTTVTAPLPQTEHDAQLRRAVIASTIGTAIESVAKIPAAVGRIPQAAGKTLLIE